MARSSISWVFRSCAGRLLIGVLILAAIAWFLRPDGPGRVHQLTLEDGTELRLIQTGEALFYDVSLYLKRPGGRWGWCFVDKEEPSWKGCGKLAWDPERRTVGIYRGSLRMAEYSPAARTITVFRMAQPIRPAPQIEQEPPY